MVTFLVTCKACGATFEPATEAIRVGNWKICPSCRPTPREGTSETRCRRCGRALRATMRDICQFCVSVPPL
jgi:hypothetical protein